MRSSDRRSTPVTWAIALLAYALVIYGGFAQGLAAMWVTDLAWTLAAFVAAFGCFQAALDLTPRHLQRAWFLFGIAFGCWFAGQVIWDWNELVRGIAVPYPSLSDIFYTAFGIVSCAALFALRVPQPARPLTPRNLGNLCLIVCSLAVATVTALFEPVAASQDSILYVGIAVLQVLSLIVPFVLSIYFLWSHRWGDETAPLILIVVSYAVHAAAVLLYVQSIILRDFNPNHYLSILWLASLGLMHWASQEQLHIARGEAPPLEVLQARERRIEASLPGALLLTLIVAAIAFNAHLSARVLAINAGLVALFAITLLMREHWIYTQERKLKSLLDHSYAELDHTRSKLDQMLAELAEKENALRLAESTGKIGLFEWDLTTRRVRYSSEWKRQLGYAQDDIGDSFEEWRHRIHPDDYPAAVAAMNRAIAHPGEELQMETRFRHRDGSYRWLLTQGSARTDDTGRVVCIAGSHVDITTLKQTEAALRESEARYRELAEQLETRVVERTAQLQDAYGELEGFAYAVSHDLKAPLRAIDGFSHLLLESAQHKLDATERDHLDRVRRGALRMAALIDGLLAYSRVERRELHRARVNLQDLANDIVTEHQILLGARPIRVICTVPKIELQIDREALLIVLRNLFDNAAKFTREVEDPQIEVDARTDGGKVTIMVRDNGIGFDPAYHDQIFSIFQRLHRNGEYDGTGIGLALARKAVQRMNGKLWAESSPGRGAAFYVELPL